MTTSELLAQETEKVIKNFPGPCAEHMKVLLKAYLVAVAQALRAEAEIHRMTKE